MELAKRIAIAKIGVDRPSAKRAFACAGPIWTCALPKMEDASIKQPRAVAASRLRRLPHRPPQHRSQRHQPRPRPCLRPRRRQRLRPRPRQWRHLDLVKSATYTQWMGNARNTSCAQRPRAIIPNMNVQRAPCSTSAHRHAVTPRLSLVARITHPIAKLATLEDLAWPQLEATIGALPSEVPQIVSTASAIVKLVGAQSQKNRQAQHQASASTAWKQQSQLSRVAQMSASKPTLVPNALLTRIAKVGAAPPNARAAYACASQAWVSALRRMADACTSQVPPPASFSDRQYEGRQDQVHRAYAVNGPSDMRSRADRKSVV